jgi:HK97 family phage portal protein
MPISSSQVKTNLLADGTVVHEYTEGANVRVFSQENMWHIKLYGNGIVGMSPLSYARNSVAVAQALDTRVNKIYSNGAKPSGILMIDRTLTAEQRAKIKENFNDLTEGQDDRLFVLEADMKYQQVSMSPQDIQLLDSRRFQIEDIGRFFGVPSVLLNQTVGQSSLGSNVYEIMQAFYKLNLRPYLEKIEASISRWLIPDSVTDRYEPRFDFDALLRADTLSRAQAFREMINSGQLTPNEARRAEGRGELPGGDSLMIQGAMVPIEQAGQQQEAFDADQRPPAE